LFGKHSTMTTMTVVIKVSDTDIAKFDFQKA